MREAPVSSSLVNRAPRFLFRSWMTPIALPSCRIGMPRICWVLKPVFLSQDPSKLKVGEIRASSALS